MNFANFIFFSLLTLSLSTSLRDSAIGEWDVFLMDSDFSKTSYTIEFHQSLLDQSSLNCTLWRDDSMNSHLPSSFIYSLQSPLTASLHVNFQSDYSGSISNILINGFNQDSYSNLHADFNFISDYGNKKISQFKIGEYSFVIDISDLDKKAQVIVEISSSLANKDININKYVLKRAKQFQNKQTVSHKQPSKSPSSDNWYKNFNEQTKSEHNVKESMKENIISKLKQLDLTNNYALLIFGLLLMINIFIIYKIFTLFCFSNRSNKQPTTPSTKKVRKHKKKNISAENQKSKKNNENQNEKPKEEKNETETENNLNKEQPEKLKTD